MVKTLHFKTNAHLKNVLGQDLINDDFVAIQELIKNSFDAGSKLVKIHFRNLKKNINFDTNSTVRDELIDSSSKILIVDSGEGMSLKDIEEKWLNIAYSSKREDREKFGRVQAGAKGVGRFSCDRLGEYLDLYTKSKKDSKIWHLQINWNDFENKNSVNDVIQKVGIKLMDSLTPTELKKKIGYTIESAGTILEISRLRREWIELSQDEYYYTPLIDLKKNLEKLINPNQSIQKNSFKISLCVEDLSKEDYDLTDKDDVEEYNYLNRTLVENKIFDSLAFRVSEITCEISKDGKYITTTLKDRNRVVFHLKEKNKFSLLKNIRVHLTYLNQYAKAYFKRQMGYRSVEFGSIFLFINGFRLSPFGDFGNDWLGLDIRKTQGQRRYLGTRDCIGRIEITDPKNELFTIVSNREGLVKNPSYDQLTAIGRTDFTKSFFYYVLRKLELFVSDVIDWDKVKDKNDPYLKGVEAGIFDYDPRRESLKGDQTERELTILSQLSKVILITSNKNDILNLTIDTDLMKGLAKEQHEKINNFISKIENEGIKLDTNTSKGMSNIKKSIALLTRKAKGEEEKRKKAESKAKQAEQKSKKAEEEKKKAESKAKKAEEEAKKSKEEKEELETQNIFLKSIQDQSKEQLVRYYHYIKTKSQTVELLTKKILKESETGGVIEKAKKLNRVNKQIFTIANIAIQGGLTEELNGKKVNLVDFFKQYLQNIHKNKLSTLKIYTIQDEEFSFKKRIKPFEIAYMVDCILDNARKMNAKKIFFSFTKKGSSLIVEIKDDGDGLPKRFSKNPATIFEQGISTTGGSGLGLYDSKNIVKDLNGKLTVSSEKKGIKLLMEIKE